MERILERPIKIGMIIGKLPLILETILENLHQYLKEWKNICKAFKYWKEWKVYWKAPAILEIILKILHQYFKVQKNICKPHQYWKK